jgi:hypothetical protein
MASHPPPIAPESCCLRCLLPGHCTHPGRCNSHPGRCNFPLRPSTTRRGPAWCAASGAVATVGTVGTVGHAHGPLCATVVSRAVPSNEFCFVAPFLLSGCGSKLVLLESFPFLIFVVPPRVLSFPPIFAHGFPLSTCFAFWPPPRFQLWHGVPVAFSFGFLKFPRAGLDIQNIQQCIIQHDPCVVCVCEGKCVCVRESGWAKERAGSKEDHKNKDSTLLPSPSANLSDKVLFRFCSCNVLMKTTSSTLEFSLPALLALSRNAWSLRLSLSSNLFNIDILVLFVLCCRRSVACLRRSVDF